MAFYENLEFGNVTDYKDNLEGFRTDVKDKLYDNIDKYKSDPSFLYSFCKFNYGDLGEKMLHPLDTFTNSIIMDGVIDLGMDLTPDYLVDGNISMDDFNTFVDENLIQPNIGNKDLQKLTNVYTTATDTYKSVYPTFENARNTVPVQSKYAVNAKSLAVRSDPDVNGTLVKTLSYDEEVYVYNEKDGYVQHPDGWSAKTYMREMDATEDTSAITDSQALENVMNMQAALEEAAEEAADVVNNSTKIYDNEDIVLKDITGLFGMPFNFLPNVDYRPAGYSYGRQYSQMLTDAAMLSITPGKANFLTGLNSDQKDDILTQLANNDTSNDSSEETTISDILDGKNARYYTFEQSSTEYWKYVNSICRLASQYLGISDRGSDIVGSDYGDMDWASYSKNTTLHKFFDGDNNYVAFYINAQSSISESLSNNTRESLLANKLKGASDTAKEGKFLLGASVESDLATYNTESFDENVKSMSDPGFFEKLGNSSKVITSGGNLVFPEIWGDSDYTKSYSVDMTFKSPTGHVEDIYLYVIVPYIHALCFTAPRQINPNGYVSPFLVRVFSKGWFNCDMGMIESLTIKKGGSGDSWNIDGLPTELEISLSIKDMYSSLAITNSDNMSLMMSNTSLIDFLATTCGVNINKPEVLRRFRSYMIMLGNKLTDIPKTVSRNIDDSIYNRLSKLFTK